MAKRRSTTSGAGHQSPATPRPNQIDAALEHGNIRLARRLASAAASSAPGGTAQGTAKPPASASAGEDNLTIAKRVLERTRPDPAALVVAAAVLVVIVLAAWLALFRVH